MSENLERVQDVFLDRINQICNNFGLNNIMAQLYAVLYFSNKTLSLDDMAERLKISKGSVSINIRALERYNVVRRVWMKGSRKDYYEAEQDITKVIMDRFKTMTENRLSEFEDMINSSYQAFDSVDVSDKEEKETIKSFKQKLDKLKNIQARARSLFSLFDKGFLNNLVKK